MAENGFENYAIHGIIKVRGDMVNKIRIFQSKEYKIWYRSLSVKTRRIVDARIGIAQKDGILVASKVLDQKLSLHEFKWASGLRVYFGLLKDEDGNFILILNGGNKNSQNKDIVSAKNTLLKAMRAILNKKSKEKDNE